MRQARSKGARETTLELPLDFASDGVPVRPERFVPPRAIPISDLHSELKAFSEFGQKTTTGVTAAEEDGRTIEVPVYVNEFWTARQRQASSLHEISYRACFKPQLPRFFIERLTKAGDVVYDPFMGRGTTLVEAALMGRVPFGNDINPLSITMTLPRLKPPSVEEITARLKAIPFDRPGEMPEDLLVFFHPETLSAIASLRSYLAERAADGKTDSVDEWIAMVALNRLTGHSSGFFSVYTLPPNQAVSVQSQRKINAQRNQTPEPRDVPRIILKKSRQLLADVSAEDKVRLGKAAASALLLTGPASNASAAPNDSANLVVTSPPFLNVVQYAADNWMRCWFLGIDAKSVKLTVPRAVSAWREEMEAVLRDVHRILRPGGFVAWEVGEVNKGQLRLEQVVLPAGVAVGLQPVLVLINAQEFTKTANCWGVDNMSKGTNTNRIVLFRKPD